MAKRVTINEIYSALSAVKPVSERSVFRRSHDEQWPYFERYGKGRAGCVREYFVTMLPSDVQNALSATATPAKIDQKMPVAEREDSLPSLAAYKKKKIYRAQEDKAYAKAELAMAYVQTLKKARYGEKEKARKIFFESYNLGDAGSYPAVFKHVGAVDVQGKTVSAWVTKLNKNSWDALCLADKRGFSKRGARGISPKQKKIILAIMRSPLNRPGSPTSELLRHAIHIMDQHGCNTLSIDTYRRWLMKDWVPYHYDEWVWWKFGEKGLNDKVARSIFRDYDKIECGDVLVADGHVLNFDILNPVTGKPKRMTLILFFDMKSSYPLGWEIMPTENTEAIHSALRRAILRLGKIPTIVYIDNGRAFKSKHFTSCDEDFDMKFKGLYARLGIRLITAIPYHGQSKTVERFFKTFGEIERMSPTFVGENIEKKPPRLSRGETMHKRLHDKITGGVIPTLEDAHRAVASWFDKYCDRKQSKSSHLNGKSPNDVMVPGPGVDPVELRHLMMCHTDVRIQQNGVYINQEWYYDQSLYGRTHRVYVRYDIQKKDSVLVYDEKTEDFICEAFKTRKVHPAATILGNEEDQAELKRQLELKAQSRKRTIATAREIVETQVIPSTRESAAASGFSLDAPATKRTKKLKKLPAPGLSDAEKKRIEKDVASIEVETATIEYDVDYVPEVEADEAEPVTDYTPEVETEARILWENITHMDEADRYEKLIELDMQGVLIPAPHQAWMRYFEMTPAYQRQEEYYMEYRAKMALMYSRAM